MKKTYKITVTVETDEPERSAVTGKHARREPNALDELFAPSFAALDALIATMKGGADKC